MTEFLEAMADERSIALALVLSFFLLLAGVAALSFRNLMGEKAPIRIFRLIGRTQFAPAVLADESASSALGEAVNRCLNCRHKEACDRWLAAARPGALAPADCPNRAFLERLARRAI